MIPQAVCARPSHSRKSTHSSEQLEWAPWAETLHSLAKRYDPSRNLIRIWVQRFKAGALDEDAVAADLIEQYEARIVALERLVGKQALELEFVKGALKSAPRQKSAPTSVIVGPPAYPSLKDAG